jgi:cytoskeletal protein CcmA (bactofilin family)
MRSRRKILIFAAVVLGVLILAPFLRAPMSERFTPPGAPAAPDGLYHDEYHLTEIVDGDWVMTGGWLWIDANGGVLGDASMVGETIHVAGKVSGSLNVIGKDVYLDPTAHIAGSATLLGSTVTVGGQVDGDLVVNEGDLTILPDAQVNGAISISCAAQITDQRAGQPALDCHSLEIPQVQPAALAILGVLGALVLTGMSALSVTFFPRHISRIEEAMRARPRSFVGVGIATYALVTGVFFAVLFLLAIFPPLGLLLVPVFLVLGLILLILCVSGLSTLAVILGDWMLRRNSRLPVPPLIAAVLGSLTLSLPLGVIALLPFGFGISVLLLGAISSVGLGAALFTRVGTRPVGRTYFIQG